MANNTTLPSAFVEHCDNKESEDFAVAKELVENLFYEMTKLCKKYDNDVFYDLPYTYSERRLDSVLLPALVKLCDYKVLVEFPTTRQSTKRHYVDEDTRGSIDYWCVYKDYSFVIELKHSFDCFTTDHTRKDKVTSRWVTMNKQLDSVKNVVKEYEEATKGVIRLGLHIITSYSDKEPNDRMISEFKDKISDTIVRFQRDFAKPYRSLKPDLIICWKIPTKIVKNDIQTFPGLWAIAKIYPEIRHKGAKNLPGAH